MLVIMAVNRGKGFIVMSKQLVFMACLGSFMLGLSSCKKNTIDTDANFFPPVQVYTQLNLVLPQYVGLTFPQGYIYIPEGNKGIVIYNRPSGGYVAFDRTCSFNPKDGCANVTVDSNYVGLRCGNYIKGNSPSFTPCCESIFDLNAGVAIQKPASRPLKQYFTSFDATNNILYVSSNPL